MITDSTPQTPDCPVLVIVPCLNEAAYIDGVIDSIVPQISGTGSKLVIADGGSTDGTIDKIRAAEARYDVVTYFHNEKRIQSAAVNQVAKAFGEPFEYLIRMDAHAEYPSDFISVLTREAQKTSADSVVIPMKTVGTQPTQKAIAVAQNSRIGNGGSAHRLTETSAGKWVDHGHHALMRTKAFLDVGGYDETFSHNEDAELDWRLTRAGHQIWLTAATEMIYFPRKTYRSLARQYFGFGAGRARTILKHRMKPRLRQVLPALLLPLSLPALFACEAWPLAIPFVGWLLLVAVFSFRAAWQQDETKSPLGALKVFGAVCIMHMAWSAGFCRSVIAYIFGHRDADTTQGDTP